MTSGIPSNNVEDWVTNAPPSQREFRQAVHVILSAIAHTPELRSQMVMKGGILMALRYQSSRFTKDIDFSTKLRRDSIEPEMIRDLFEGALPLAAETLDYGLDCRVQKFAIRPPGDDATFPSIHLRIGYAVKGTPKHKRLLARTSSDVVSIDFSLNEPIINVENISLDGSNDETVLAYAFTDLIAEKIRSLLQQEKRNRFRRQDVYDLELLLRTHPPDAEETEAILDSLWEKAASRGIAIRPNSLANEEIRQRAQRDYPTLSDEVEGGLPDFDIAYNTIEIFYRTLPWNSLDPGFSDGF